MRILCHAGGVGEGERDHTHAYPVCVWPRGEGEVKLRRPCLGWPREAWPLLSPSRLPGASLHTCSHAGHCAGDQAQPAKRHVASGRPILCLQEAWTIRARLPPVGWLRGGWGLR